MCFVLIPEEVVAQMAGLTDRLEVARALLPIPDDAQPSDQPDPAATMCASVAMGHAFIDIAESLRAVLAKLTEGDPQP